MVGPGHLPLELSRNHVGCYTTLVLDDWKLQRSADTNQNTSRTRRTGGCTGTCTLLYSTDSTRTNHFVDNMKDHSRHVAAILALFWSMLLVDAYKIRRVKAGKIYKQHDPVHLVVNKVG